MNLIFATLLATTFVLALVYLLWWTVGYISHLYSKDDDKTLDYGYANYKIFKREFESINWHVYSKYTLTSNARVPFLLEAKDIISVDQFVFNDRIMIIRNPIGYILAIIKIKKYIKDNYRKPNQNKIKW